MMSIGKITDTELNIKVAELSGMWANIQMSENIWPEGIEEGWQKPGIPFGHRKGIGHPEHMVTIPDYSHDLNAMHEVEKNMTEWQCNNYSVILDRLWKQGPVNCYADCLRYHISARQKAEAFVEAITEKKF